jgi:PST family polysaccharide transporter
MPFLARVLGPSVLGTVAFVSSLGGFIVLAIEFGFTLSATRQIAQNRNSPDKCAWVIAGVLGAQALLAVLSISIALIGSRYIQLLRDNPVLLAAALIYGVCQGIYPLWLFQGLERLQLAAGLEIAGKLVGTAGIFLVVRSPEDAWKVVLLQAVAPLLSTVIGFVILSREFSFRIPTAELVWQALQSGWRLFVFRSGGSLYGMGNAFILGLFANSAAVGYYSVAEKIANAVFGLLNPVRDALYPRMSQLAVTAPKEAARLARIGVAPMILSGLGMGLALFVFAPQLILAATGGNFQPAVTVLRLLAFLPPLLSISVSVGTQWLLPFGRDAIVNRIVLTAGLLNFALAFALAPKFQQVGMAASVLIAEIYVCTRMVLTVAAAEPFWSERFSVVDEAAPR